MPNIAATLAPKAIAEARPTAPSRVSASATPTGTATTNAHW